jgi:hypothetical protein
MGIKMSLTLAEARFSNRIVNALCNPTHPERNPPIKTLEELVSKSACQLFTYPGIGETSVREIMDRLKQEGLCLFDYTRDPDPTKELPRVIDVWRLCRQLKDVVDDFLPNVSKCELKDYEGLSNALVAFGKMSEKIEGGG